MLYGLEDLQRGSASARMHRDGASRERTRESCPLAFKSTSFTPSFARLTAVPAAATMTDGVPARASSVTARTPPWRKNSAATSCSCADDTRALRRCSLSCCSDAALRPDEFDPHHANTRPRDLAADHQRLGGTRKFDSQFKLGAHREAPGSLERESPGADVSREGRMKSCCVPKDTSRTELTRAPRTAVPPNGRRPNSRRTSSRSSYRCASSVES